MQIHPRTGFPEAITARVNRANPDSPFVTLGLDTYEIIVESPDEADKLINAAILAKSMLLGETGEPLPVLAEPPASAQWDGTLAGTCPAFWGTGSGETPMRCELAPYHPGLHGNGGIEWGAEVPA
jgi:hypothetical protein